MRGFQETVLSSLSSFPSRAALNGIGLSGRICRGREATTWLSNMNTRKSALHMCP